MYAVKLRQNSHPKYIHVQRELYSLEMNRGIFYCYQMCINLDYLMENRTQSPNIVTYLNS